MRRTEPGLAQQATRGVSEPGEKEVLDERQARVRRGEAVTVLDPCLGAQVVEIDPHRRSVALAHPGDKTVWQMAGKGFDDDVAGCDIRVLRPVR